MMTELNEENIKQNLETMAEEIKRLKRVGDLFSMSELNEKTVIWLISRASGVSQGNVSKIMSSLQRMEEIFLKQKD